MSCNVPTKEEGMEELKIIVVIVGFMSIWWWLVRTTIEYLEGDNDE